jgi:AcrR family transcriptional regulator
VPQPSERADRILDAAGELMIRLGYRKVTIDDIAGQAGIGKGTVYLHWRTKERLFEALILRESVGLIAELVDGLRHGPEKSGRTGSSGTRTWPPCADR